MATVPDNPHADWEQLTALATLGLQRGAVGSEMPWPEASLAVAGSSGEQALLRAAIATHLWRVAGTRASAASSANASPALAEPGPQISEAAAWRLARMINGEYGDLLPEWFQLAAASGKTLPAHWLPLILDRVVSPICQKFPAVLGPAAAWLTTLNRNWSLQLTDRAPDEQKWIEGTLDERRAELAAQRKLDPAVARRWLQSTWETDPPEAREAFINVLLTRPSPDDEAFLESALDDKRKAVRLAAADCLSRLPSSAHAQRNLARVDPLLQMEEPSGLLSKLRKRKLDIQLPASIDKAAQRDGIEPKPPAQRKIGERAFWLTQMISMVEPSHWCRRFNCDAATLVKAAIATDYATDLLSAMSAATARHPDREWMMALADGWLDWDSGTDINSQALVAFIEATPDSDRVAVFDALLGKVVVRNSRLAGNLLNEVDLPWTASMTTLAIQHLGKLVKEAAGQQWSLPRNTLDAWARHCDVSTALEALAALLARCDEKSSWRNAIEQMNDIVAVRVTMRKELLT
jgi:hypothetical protein